VRISETRSGGQVTPVERGGSLLSPVVVTGSTGRLGRALLVRLASFPSEPRPVLPDESLAAACRDASAVVHLDDGVRPGDGRTQAQATLDATHELVDALAESAVERIVFLSDVGADPHASSEYLRAKAAEEALLHGCGRDVVIFRCTHVFGPPDDPGEVVGALVADDRHRVLVAGTGAQRVAPVYRDDVVDAAVAALDPRTYHGRFDLPGPEVMTLDQLVRVVNPDPVTIHHVSSQAAGRFRRALPGVRPELGDLMMADNLGEQFRADRAFGLRRRGVSEIYRRDTPV
jgi:nucleoside-diphosphate-sugar epimerase